MKKILFILFSIIISFVSFTSTNKTIVIAQENLQNNCELYITMVGLGTEGDCSLIQIKNKNSTNSVDILIDVGGSEKDSKDVILNLLNDKIKDSTLDFVIITHPDLDHIANFESSLYKWLKGDLFNKRKINYLIDFDNKNNSISTNKFDVSNFYSNYYYKYKETRNKIIREKYLNEENYYSSLSTLLPKKFILGKDFNGNDITLKFLNNEFADVHNFMEYHKINKFENSDKNLSAARNCLSTCAMITYNNQKFLFTGDIEEFDSAHNRVNGETLLYKNNIDDLKDGVFFYKSAHHGSYTSNSKELLDFIRPQYIAVNTVFEPTSNTIYQLNKRNNNSSSDKVRYRFPSDTAIEHMTKWTDYIFFTEKYVINNQKNGFDVVPFYGNQKNLEFSFDGETFLHNNKEPESILDNQYYYSNRAYAVSIMNFDSCNHSICDDKINCAYIKLGHIDILINDGFSNTNDPNRYKKINELMEKYCNDGVLDYLIVTDGNTDSINGLVGKKIKETRDGLLPSILNKTSKIKTILNYVDKDYGTYSGYTTQNNYFEYVKKLRNTYSEIDNIKMINNYYSSKNLQLFNNLTNFDNKIEIKIFDLISGVGHEASDNPTIDKNSLSVLVKIKGQNIEYYNEKLEKKYRQGLSVGYLNTGHAFNLYDLEQSYPNKLKKAVNYYQVPNYGYAQQLNNTKNIYSLNKSSIFELGNDKFLLASFVTNLKNVDNISINPTSVYNQVLDSMYSCHTKTNKINGNINDNLTLEYINNYNNFSEYDNDGLLGRCLLGCLGHNDDNSLSTDISYRRMSITYNRCLKNDFNYKNVTANDSLTQKLNNNINSLKNIFRNLFINL